MRRPAFFQRLGLATMIVCGLLQTPGVGQVPNVQPPKEKEKPSLFDGIRQIIGDSPAFDDSEVSDGLLESLNQAEKTFQEIRQSNREAIRGMNRQIRIGRAKQSPHIILVTVPQLRFDQLPAMPRLTGIRTSGITFTNYYASSDRFSSSRWSLLTGHLASQAPADGHLTQPQSLGEMMWKSGYDTTILGTWGSSQHPVELGFDHWTGFPSANGYVEKYPEFFFSQSTQAKIVNKDSSSQPDSLNLVTSEVLQFLQTHQRSERQFYLHVGLPYLKGVSNEENLEQVDLAIGRIVDDINTRGLAGRVCLIVCGETSHRISAEITKDLPVVGTRLTYSQSGLNEGNMRTPLIVFCAKHAARGATSDVPCSGLDLLPTLGAIAQSQRVPSGVSGLSLLPAIQGKPVRAERLLYWRMADGGQAARRGRWKVIVPAGGNELELYDLGLDPTESTNVAQQHPDIVQGFVIKSAPPKTEELEAL